MNIHIYNLFYICTGTHACMGFVPDNKLIRIRTTIAYIIMTMRVFIRNIAGGDSSRWYCQVCKSWRPPPAHPSL